MKNTCRRCWPRSAASRQGDKETRRSGDGLRIGSFSLTPCLLVSLSGPPLAERLQQRFDMRGISPPAADGTRVDRLPHLHSARRMDGPAMLVIVQAGIAPFQPAEFDERAGHVRRPSHQLLVADFEHA